MILELKLGLLMAAPLWILFLFRTGMTPNVP